MLIDDVDDDDDDDDEGLATPLHIAQMRYAVCRRQLSLLYT